MITRLLAHPLTVGLGVDDPRMTAVRQQIVREKTFLNKIYQEWYQTLVSELPAGPGQILEVGSGAGFLKSILPDMVASEIFPTPGIDVVMDATTMPMHDGSLKAIVMTDVFHHIPKVDMFLDEAARVLKPGGRLIMVEPWVTKWSTFIYQHFHSEPFVVDAPEWRFPTSGPLSGANGALPWMVFERDKHVFAKRFPHLRLQKIVPMMPVAYLLSGGVSLRSLSPGWLYRTARLIETFVPSLSQRCAMFALIVVDHCGKDG
jgi:SAM-dependent methyltransferase